MTTGFPCLALVERGIRPLDRANVGSGCTLTFTRREAALALPSSAAEAGPSPALVAARVRFMTSTSRVPARVQQTAAWPVAQV